MRKGRKGSLEVSNVRRKIAHVDVPEICLLSIPLFVLISALLKTSCFTPLKEALDPLSSSAMILETSFGLLVGSVNEQKEMNTQI